MKPALREEFQREFERVSYERLENSQDPLDMAYASVGSQTMHDESRPPLQFTSQGSSGKLTFEVNMTKCKWRKP